MVIVTHKWHVQGVKNTLNSVSVQCIVSTARETSKNVAARSRFCLTLNHLFCSLTNVVKMSVVPVQYIHAQELTSCFCFVADQKHTAGTGNLQDILCTFCVCIYVVIHYYDICVCSDYNLYTQCSTLSTQNVYMQLCQQCSGVCHATHLVIFCNTNSFTSQQYDLKLQLN